MLYNEKKWLLRGNPIAAAVLEALPVLSSPQEWDARTFAHATRAATADEIAARAADARWLRKQRPIEATADQVQEALDLLEREGLVCRNLGGAYMRREIPTGAGGPAYQVKPGEIRALTADGRAELERIQKAKRKAPIPRDKRRKITLADVKREAQDDGRLRVFECEGTTFRLFGE